MHFSVTFLLITFFVHFLKTQWIWNQREILRFYTFFSWKKNFLGHISTFSNFEAKRAKNQRQKSTNLLSKYVLEFNYGTINGLVQPSC